MRITRTKLEGIIFEEVSRRIAEVIGLAEDKPETRAADEEPAKKKTGGPKAPKVRGPEDRQDAETDPDFASDNSDEEQDAAQDEMDALDTAGDGAGDPSGLVNKEISGKTVQAITINPKSDRLPDAKEILVTFNETTDPLKILVTSTGKVVFLWRERLHDLP